jgi:hypothetical protein
MSLDSSLSTEVGVPSTHVEPPLQPMTSNCATSMPYSSFSVSMRPAWIASG